MRSDISYAVFDPAQHLDGICRLLRDLEWDNFRYDPELTERSMTASGVTTLVACESGEVVGFAQVFADRVGCQAHLSLLAVDERWRRCGIARRLVDESFERLGAKRMDLIASDESVVFYRSLAHREQVGFRLYPNEDVKEAG